MAEQYGRSIRKGRLRFGVTQLALCSIFSSPALGQVTYQEFTEAKAGSNVTSLTISTPAGVSAGDLLITAVATDGDNSASLAPPAGEAWVQIALDTQGSSMTFGVWWKIAESSESGTHQFSWSSSQQAYGWMMRFTGHDAIAPIDASATNGGTSSTPTSPAVTTTIANTLILRLGGFDDDDVTVDSPGLAGHTAITMDESKPGSGSSSGGAGYVAQAAVASSGTSTFSLTASEEYRAVTIAIAQSPTIDLASGLVAFWKLNEGSGTNATDSSSNTNDGTLTNSPAWTDGVHGGAVNFDGVDDYIDAGSDASIDDMWAGGGTLTAWIFIEGSGEATFGRIADKASTVDATVGWALKMNGGTTALRWEAGFTATSGIWTTPGNSVSADSWYHVALVYDSDSADNDPLIYINGVSQTVTNSTPPLGNYSTDAALALRLGNFAGGTTRTFDGSLDDIRIYSRELSTGEIIRLANGAGLVGHWKLDDGGGATASDSAGSNDGTLTNGPTWTTGRLCGALTLDGTNDYVELVGSSTLISGDVSFSLSGWIQTTTLYDSAPNPLFLGARIVTIYQSDLGSQTSKAAIGLYGDNTDTVMFMYGNPGVSGITKTSTSFNDGNWHHLAGTYDAATNVATLYYDGVAVATEDAGTIVSAGTETARIGTGTVTNLGILNGLVDDVRVFSRALASWEIKNLAATYQVIDLGSASGEPSLGLCVNDSEQVGGFDETAAAGNSTAWFQQYCEFTTIATLTGGSVNEALGINNAGTVVGWSAATGGIFKAFSWTSGGGTTDLGLLSGRSDSEGLGVNSSNEVCGTALNIGPPPTSRLAFLYLPVAAYSLSMGMNSLGTLGGTQSLAVGINDSGEVVGGAQDATPTMKPFIWLPSAAYGFGAGMNSLGTLGGESTDIVHRAHAINATGEVVGRSYTAGGEGHAFHWETGTMTDMGVLTAGTSSFALDINDSGNAVGTANVSGGAFHAFVWDGSNMTDLNSLIDSNSGWTLIRATGINSDGEIVGWGTNGSGDVRAFMLVQTCAASTSTTSSLAAVVLAEGSGTTDINGEFEEVVLDADGESLGEITILEADPDVTVEFEVVQPDDSAGAGLGPAPGTLEGFADGIAIRRTLMVETSAAEGNFIAIVSMTFFASELDDSAVDPEEVELHVLDATLGSPPGVWVPAGLNIGESVPTGIVGDSGFEVYADTTINFWAVRGAAGIFAVGAAMVAQGDEMPPHDDDPGIADDAGPRVVPPVCGLGLVPFSLVALTMLIAIRRRQYGS